MNQGRKKKENHSINGEATTKCQKNKRAKEANFP